MNRRDFLLGTAAVPAVAALPALPALPAPVAAAAASSGNTLLTPEMISREALRILKQNLICTAQVELMARARVGDRELAYTEAFDDEPLELTIEQFAERAGIAMGRRA